MNMHYHILRAVELAQTSDISTEELYVALASLCALAESRGKLAGVRESNAAIEAHCAIAIAQHT